MNVWGRNSQLYSSASIGADGKCIHPFYSNIVAINCFSWCLIWLYTDWLYNISDYTYIIWMFQLYGSVIPRLVGQTKNRDTPCGSPTSAELFHKFPKLEELLLASLTNREDDGRLLVSGGTVLFLSQMIPFIPILCTWSVHFALILLRLYYRFKMNIVYKSMVYCIRSYYLYSSKHITLMVQWFVSLSFLIIIIIIILCNNKKVVMTW